MNRRLLLGNSRLIRYTNRASLDWTPGAAAPTLAESTAADMSVRSLHKLPACTGTLTAPLVRCFACLGAVGCLYFLGLPPLTDSLSSNRCR